MTKEQINKNFVDTELSALQKGIWFLYKLNPESSSYNTYINYEIEGALDTDKFYESLKVVCNFFPAFKTKFLDNEDSVIQRIYDHIDDISFSKITINDKRTLRDYIKQLNHLPFELSNSAAYKFYLINCEKKYYFIAVQHHILTDGFSGPLFMGALGKIYNNPQLQLSDYYSQQSLKDFNSFVQSQPESLSLKKKEYWQEILKDSDFVFDFGEGFSKKSEVARQLSLRAEIGEDLYKKIKSISKKYKTLPFLYLSAVWSALLFRYFSNNSFLLGYPENIRPKAFSKIYGYFISVLPLNIQISEETTFEQLLQQLTEQKKRHRGHNLISFYELSKLINKERNSTLDFNIGITPTSFYNKQLELDNCSTKGIEASGAGINPDRDLSISCDFETPNLEYNIFYNSSIFSDYFIKQFDKHFRQFVEFFAQNPKLCLSDVSLVNVKDLPINTESDSYLSDKTAYEMFEEQSSLFPNKIAIKSNEGEITYKDLNQRANQFARFLLDKGVQPDDLVALHMDRSIDAIVAILAIIKAGGGYVPIDTEYPENRVTNIVNESRTNLFITDQDTNYFSFSQNVEIINYKESLVEISTYEESNLGRTSAPNNLVYVIFTSGSTGKPKGVMIEHHALVNLAASQKNHFFLSNLSSVSQSHSLSFDASVYEVFGTLFAGATLKIIQKDELLNTEFHKKLFKDLTHFLASSSLLSKLDPSDFNNGTVVMSAGEAINFKEVQRWVPRVKLLNGYGPSEITVCASTCELKNNDSYVSIGSAIANKSIYILDKYKNLVPIGVPGEIYVGGKGIARGYLNNEVLTKEKFIKDPFSEDMEARLYKTGDLAKWHSDGNIEFLNRIDNQVKIRGYRIELSEIENTILQLDSIKSAVVVVHENESKSKSICAYIVPQNITDDISFAKIDAFVKGNLPKYMAPSNYVLLEKIPLTTNGKVDIKKLPKPSEEKKRSHYKLTGIEEKVASIFAQALCLQKENLDISASFFDLGGDSLQIIKVTSLIKSELKTSITIKEFFDHSSIIECSNFISNSKQCGDVKSLSTTKKKPSYPLPPNLKQMYLLDKTEHNLAYNTPFLCKISIPVEFTVLERKIIEILNFHDAYHFSFGKKGNDIVAFYNKKIRFSLRKIKTRAINKYNIQSLVSSFDLSKAPLVNIVMIESNEGKYLFVDHHHIIADKSSIDIFLRDLLLLLSGKELNPLKVNYSDYLQYSTQESSLEIRNKNTEYWIKKLENNVSPISLPYDYIRPKDFSNKGDVFHINLDTKISAEIVDLCRKFNCTQSSFFLGIFALFLNRYSNNEKFIIGIPSSTRFNSEVEDVIGYFVNVLPLCIDIGEDDVLSSFFRKLSNSLVESLNYGDFDFGKVVKQIDQDRDLSRHPLFDLVFSYNEADDLANSGVIPVNSNIVKFDLVFSVIKSNNQFLLSMEYASSLFKESTIDRFLEAIVYGINQIINTPDRCMSEISFVGEEEQKDILSFNTESDSYLSDKTAYEMFEEQSSLFPNKIAIKSNEGEITYKDLNQRANQFARFLLDKGVQPDDLVALHMDRSIDAIVAILAIIKAGGGYVPIDTEYPENRVTNIVNESRTNLFITDQDINSFSFSQNVEIINYKESLVEISTYEESNLGRTSAPNNLVYVIFTSGSTGKPKGVMIEHHALVNLTLAQGENFNITSDSNFAHIQSIAFDASVDEIFSTLLNGACLCIIDKNTLLTPSLLESFIRTNTVSHILLPASFLQRLDPRNIASTLYKVIAVGDKLPLLEAKKWSEYTDVLNGYGPSEATICTSVGLVNMTSNYASIGSAIANKSIYILDKYKNLVPIGVPGEIYVGGKGIARGYLNNEVLTKEKFIKDPFSQDMEARLYKTGDLAKWHSDGNIEFLNRIDNQVKIRGYRIELSEIENTILQLDSIKSAVVVVHENESKSKSICAYIVPQNITDDISFTKIDAFVKGNLPKYMVPSNYVLLEKIPLTTNGKVDIKELPKPKKHNITSESLSNTESTLIKIISSIIRIDINSISIHDNFLNIGGDSLSIIDFQEKIFKQYGKQLSFNEIYKANSLKQIARQIEENLSNINSNIIVPLNSNKNNAKVFFIHGASGTCHLFNDIASQTEMSLYGVEAPQDLLSKFDSIQKLAKLYLEEISPMSSTPYYIAAWSFGSLIAMEMLKILSASSRQLPHVFLLDPHNVNKDKREILWLFFFEQIIDNQDSQGTFRQLYKKYKDIEISFNTLYEMLAKHKMLMGDKILLRKLYNRYSTLLTLKGISEYNFKAPSTTIIRPNIQVNNKKEKISYLNEIYVKGNHFSMLDEGAEEIVNIIQNQHQADIKKKKSTGFIAA